MLVPLRSSYQPQNLDEMNLLFYLYQLIWTVDTISIDVDKPVNIVDKRFLSVAIDSHVIAERWKNFRFDDPGVLAMAKALSPAYLRIGGTAADLLIFDENGYVSDEFVENGLIDEGNGCDCDGYGKGKKKRTNFTMTGVDWIKLNEFCRSVGWKLLFDANVLIRDKTSNNWNTSNIQSLINFSISKGYDIAWELGNEPNSIHHQLNVSLPPNELGRDFARFRQILDTTKVFKDATLVGPDVNSLARCVEKHKKSCKALDYLEKVVKSSNGALDAVTWHHYYLDGHTAKIQDFLKLDSLDVFKRTLKMVQKFVRNKIGIDKELWLGETSSAYGGGAKGLSDRYVAGFLWLDKLGMSARYGHSVVIRQSFYHGCYAMIGEDLQPNPDLWISVIHKKLVGRKVLKVIRPKNHDARLRLYAHCASNATTGVILFASNISPKHTSFFLKNPFSNSTQIHHYILSPHDGGIKGLTSRKIMLNGKELPVLPDPLSNLVPRKTTGSSFLAMKPYEMAFWVFPHVKIPACA